MKYGAFGLVEVLGSCNAVMVIDRCSRQQTYLFAPGTANAVDMKLFL